MIKLKYHIFCSFLILILITSGCIKEVEREFSRIETLGYEIIDNGVILRAEISNYDSKEIEEYGFLLGEGAFNVNSELFNYEIDSKLDSRLFEIKLTTGLEEGKSYFFMAYAISNGVLSIGTDLAFVSGGSDPPELLEFSPQYGLIGDTITISCGNLFGTKDNYAVKFSDFDSKIISIADSLITVIVPINLDVRESIISVSAYGQTASFSTTYTLLTPEIDSFSPLEVSPGEEVNIIGSNFHKNTDFLNVYFDDSKGHVISSSGSQIIVVAPIPADSMNIIRVENISGQNDTAEQMIKIKGPVVAGFYPANGTYGDQITIFGENVGAFPIQSITIGNTTAQIISVATDEIIIIVPNELNVCISQITINYSGVSIAYDTHFTLDSPLISGFDKSEVDLNSDLIIYGENFSPIPSMNLVSIGTMILNPVSATSTELTVRVGFDFPEGNYIVGVKTCGGYHYSTETINVTNIQLIPQNGLIGYYPFEIDARDESGNGIDGTLSGAQIIPGRVDNNKVSKFDGVDDFISLGNVHNEIISGNDKQFSIAFWIKLDSELEEYRPIITKTSDRNCSVDERQFVITKTPQQKINVIWFGNLGGTTLTGVVGNTAISDTSKWYHVAVVYDGMIDTNNGLDRVSIYINGIKDGTSLSHNVHPIGDMVEGPAHFGFGAQVNNLGQNCYTTMHGQLDDVLIYDRLLTEEEITGIF